MGFLSVLTSGPLILGPYLGYFSSVYLFCSIQMCFCFIFNYFTLLKKAKGRHEVEGWGTCRKSYGKEWKDEHDQNTMYTCMK